MSNHEYHQRYLEAMKKLAGNAEHQDWCPHWKQLQPAHSANVLPFNKLEGYTVL